MSDIYGSEDDADVLALAESMRAKENARRKKRKRPELGPLTRPQASMAATAETPVKASRASMNRSAAIAGQGAGAAAGAASSRARKKAAYDRAAKGLAGG